MALCTIPKYISREQVGQLLSWPMVNDAVEEALKAVSPINGHEGSYAEQPARTMTVCGDKSKILFAMPGFIGNYQLSSSSTSPPTPRAEVKNTLACKLVTSFSNNAKRQPPMANILANILLFDTETGELKCIMDGTQITAWRTAAASVVATKHLYSGIDRPIKLAIVGCGVQGESHALGMCHTFKIAEIHLWNRTRSKADLLAKKIKDEFPGSSLIVQVHDAAKDAVAEADVICVGTYSPNALIDYSMLKTKGDIHINTVGAGQVHFGEVAQDIYDHAVVYIDSKASALEELAELKARVIGAVGDVIRTGKRTENERITIFQSLGMAVEDATTAQAVYDAMNK